MAGQHLFHFTRVHIVAAGNNQILLAVFNEKEAILIHTGDVASVQPAVTHGIGRFGGHLPVAGHDVRPLHNKLAHLANRQNLVAIFRVHNARSNVGEGQANPRPVLTIDRIGVRNHVRFRQAIPLHQLRARQLLKFALGFQQQRCRTGDTGADRFETVLARSHVRVVVDGNIHRRHTREDSDIVFADAFQHILQVARVHNDDHGAGNSDGQVHGRNHPIRMEQGDGGQDYFLAITQIGQPRLHHQAVGGQVAVQGNGPFG